MTLAVAIAQGGANNVTMRNRIINGAMMIDQRNAGASVTINSNQYTLDRYQAVQTQTGKYSVQQSTTAPTGFKNSILITSASAYSIISTDTFYFRQSIEGYIVADLAYGTANAATVTLSFWVRSSLTGAFGGALKNDAGNRSYPFSFTINSANTWEQKTITIAGDTTGTWDTGTARGLQVIFGLGVGSTFSTTAGSWAGGDYSAPTGSTSVVGTSGATFYITGVQLEAGTTATAFEQRLYGTELALCQRYYLSANISGMTGAANNSTFWVGNYYFPVAMRATPTTATSTTATRITNLNVLDYVGSYPMTATPTSPSFLQVTATYSSGTTLPTGVPLTLTLPATITITASAEL